MKRFIIVIIPSLLSLSLSASALGPSARAQMLRPTQRSYLTKDIEDHYRLGHRRSTLAQYQNAERRALQRHQEAERKLARLRGINRRVLATTSTTAVTERLTASVSPRRCRRCR